MQNTKEELFLLKFKATEERKKWVNAINILRNESLSELKPIEFPVFSCIEETEQFDELFAADEINYDYNKVEVKNRRVERKIATFRADKVEFDPGRPCLTEDEGILNRSAENLSSDDSDRLDIERRADQEEEFEEWEYKPGNILHDVYFNLQEEPDSTLTKVKNFFGFR